MTLKELIAADIGSVFLNFDDFAEEITIGGETVPACCEELPPATAGGTSQQKYEGTFKRVLLVFVRNLARPPIIGKRVNITRAGREGRFTCRRIIEEGGMMRIELEMADS